MSCSQKPGSSVCFCMWGSGSDQQSIVLDIIYHLQYLYHICNTRIILLSLIIIIIIIINKTITIIAKRKSLLIRHLFQEHCNSVVICWPVCLYRHIMYSSPQAASTIYKEEYTHCKSLWSTASLHLEDLHSSEIKPPSHHRCHLPAKSSS